MTADQQKIFDTALATLTEHFEVVHIFVQDHDPKAEQTEGYNDGHGNVFARRQQIGDWLDQCGEPEDDDGKGDDWKKAL